MKNTNFFFVSLYTVENGIPESASWMIAWNCGKMCNAMSEDMRIKWICCLFFVRNIERYVLLFIFDWISRFSISNAFIPVRLNQPKVNWLLEFSKRTVEYIYILLIWCIHCFISFFLLIPPFFGFGIVYSRVQITHLKYVICFFVVVVCVCVCLLFACLFFHAFHQIVWCIRVYI